MTKSLWIALLVTTSAATAYPADPDWYEITSPHFRILTDGSEKEGREVAREFEQIRALLATVMPSVKDRPVPLVIVAARNEGSARRLIPEAWKQAPVKPAGIFRDGLEWRDALVRLDLVRRGNATQLASFGYQRIYHGYIRGLIHANVRWLPGWLDIGLGEFFANTRFQDGKVYVGAPFPALRNVQSRPRFPMATFININPSSGGLRDGASIETFYGQSWALVHMLMMSPKEDGKGLQSFVSLLESGKSHKDAFQQAVGDIDEIGKKIDAYLFRRSFQNWVLTNPAQIREDSFSSRKLSIAEADAEIGHFQIWHREASAARIRLEKALKADPQISLAHEGMGFVHFMDGKDQEALQEFERAVELNDSSYLAHYYRAMLSPQARSDEVADQNALRSSLLRVLELNPDFAPAYVELAALDIRQNNLKAALLRAQQAEGLAPSKGGYQSLVADLLHGVGRDDEAEALTRNVAERWGGLVRDEATSVRQKITGEVPKGELFTPAPPTENMTLAAGKITSLTCDAKNETISLVLDGVPLTLRTPKNRIVGEFSDTIWYGSDHFSFCRHLEGLQAAVYYRPPASPTELGSLTRFNVHREFSIRP